MEKTIDMRDYGYIPTTETYGCVARVTAVHKERYDCVCEYGSVSARLKAAQYYAGSELFPTTGDFVQIDHIPDSECRIVKTLPRKTVFERLEPSENRAQAVAANFDYVFVLQSLNKNFNIKRLERYMTLSWQSGATPVVVLTKADVAEDLPEKEQAARRIAIGAEIHTVSSKTGYGMDALKSYLKYGKTVVFLGSSGVGKSTLANTLCGFEFMSVSDIREEDSRGRHTTTYRQLIKLENGAMIIDTPGMRELGMWDVSSGIDAAFADVEQYLGKCRFSDCRHMSEPGCAVLEAIKSGELSQERWDSYMALKKEARYSDDKQGYLRSKDEFFKQIAKVNALKKRKKHD